MDDRQLLRALLVNDAGERVVWRPDFQPPPATLRLMSTLGVEVQVVATHAKGKTKPRIHDQADTIARGQAWQDHRASLARASSRQDAGDPRLRRCGGCQCEVDILTPRHAPNCKWYRPAPAGQQVDDEPRGLVRAQVRGSTVRVSTAVHSTNGSGLTAGEMRRRWDAQRDAGEITIACGLDGCGWTITKAFGEARVEAQAHRERSHPELLEQAAKRRPRRVPRRERVDVDEGLEALERMDAGEPQSESHSDLTDPVHQEVALSEPESVGNSAVTGAAATTNAGEPVQPGSLSATPDTRPDRKLDTPAPEIAPAQRQPPGGAPRRWTPETVADAIRALGEELGRAPTQVEAGPPLRQAAVKRCGSWGAAVEAAGFARPTRGTRYSGSPAAAGASQKDSSGKRADSQSTERGHARLHVDGAPDAQHPPLRARLEGATADGSGEPERPLAPEPASNEVEKQEEASLEELVGRAVTHALERAEALLHPERPYREALALIEGIASTTRIEGDDVDRIRDIARAALGLRPRGETCPAPLN